MLYITVRLFMTSRIFEGETHIYQLLFTNTGGNMKYEKYKYKCYVKDIKIKCVY